jgi:hypothetical protein
LAATAARVDWMKRMKCVRRTWRVDWDVRRTRREE